MTAVDTGFWSQLADRYDDEHNYMRNPVSWMGARLKEHQTEQQKQIANSVVANRYTAVHACHESGKSKIAANIGAWWNDVHPTGSAFLVSTAPSAAQVSAVLWREIGKNHTKAKLIGKINRAGYPQWFVGGELIGYGRKPSDYEESAFNGIHARYVLVIIDEAGGVTEHLFNAVDSLVANDNGRVLAIGNPDDPGSHFAEICKPGSIWNTIHMDGLRSPNFSDELTRPYPLTRALMEAEQIPFSDEPTPPILREVLLGPLWVEERLRSWCGVPEGSDELLDHGELLKLVRQRSAASAIFQAKVRGVFPTSTATGVIPLGWVQQAVNRWRDYVDAHSNDAGDIDYSQVTNPRRRVVGVDVAYGGMDETVLAVRYGDFVDKLNRFRHADTVETADEATAYLQEPQSMAVVDVIGIGAGVFDTLRRYRHEYNEETGEMKVTPSATIVAFNAAAANHRTDKIGEFRFRNDRAAAWWKMRELLDPSRGSTIMLPDDERLQVELTSVKYKHLVGGVIQIESKDDIRKRLGRSTDSADAVIQAFWVEGLSASQMVSGHEYASTKKANRGAVKSYEGFDIFTEADLAGRPGIVSGQRLHSQVRTDKANQPGGWDI